MKEEESGFEGGVSGREMFQKGTARAARGRGINAIVFRFGESGLCAKATTCLFCLRPHYREIRFCFVPVQRFFLVLFLVLFLRPRKRMVALVL